MGSSIGPRTTDQRHCTKVPHGPQQWSMRLQPRGGRYLRLIPSHEEIGFDLRIINSTPSMHAPVIAFGVTVTSQRLDKVSRASLTARDQSVRRKGRANCQYICIDVCKISAHNPSMAARPKIDQLQIRVSPSEKASIQRAAKRAGLDMSNYVLSKVISVPANRFQECIAAAAGLNSSYGLAELNSLLTKLSTFELESAVAAAPAVSLSPFVANYVAAMVELACALRAIPIPHWTRTILPLVDPWFGSSVLSLRHHLLISSPAPFRRRNIFIDSSLGSRV
jgi:hypothetical protein